MLLNLLAFCFAAGLLMWVLFSRLRQINWKTARATYVLMYVAFAWWLIGMADEALDGRVQGYQAAGMVALLCMLLGTRHQWKEGPPANVTKPTPLSEPEVSGFL